MIKLTAELIEGFVGSVLMSSFDEPAPTPEFHRELWELCCSEAPLVAVAAPRGHAKSTAVSLAYVLAAALFRDRTFIILVSDTEGQAKEFLGDIKKELQTNENLIELFGVKSFPKDSETDIIVKMEDGYEFRIIAKGSEQKVRGLKWKHMRPDLIVCDDIENDEIVMNQERREKFRNWVLKALLPCRSARGIVRIVGTILHLDSFLARVCPLDGEKHTERVGAMKLVSNNPRAMFKSVVYAAHVGGNPTEIESLDDVLWPYRLQQRADKEGESVLKYTKDWFLGKYHVAVELGSPEGYSQEYLNKPLDDSNTLFRRSDFVAMTTTDKEEILNGKKPLHYYAGVDLAISEKERADWSVFHVVGIDSNGIMYHTNTIRERLDGKEIVETVFRLFERYNLEWLAIEQDKIGKALGAFIRDRSLRTGSFPTIIEITPSKDKQMRMRSIQARMRMQSIRFDKDADYFPVLQKEFLEFPRSRHDDQVDAYSCIGLALDKMTDAQTHKEVLDDEFEEERRSSIMSNGRSAITGY